MPSDAELILGYKEQLLLARAVGIEKGNLDRKLDSDSWDRICRVTGLTKSTAQFVPRAVLLELQLADYICLP